MGPAGGRRGSRRRGRREEGPYPFEVSFTGVTPTYRADRCWVIAPPVSDLPLSSRVGFAAEAAPPFCAKPGGSKALRRGSGAGVPVAVYPLPTKPTWCGDTNAAKASVRERRV